MSKSRRLFWVGGAMGMLVSPIIVLGFVWAMFWDAIQAGRYAYERVATWVSK